MALDSRFPGSWLDENGINLIKQDPRPHQSLEERMTPDAAYFGAQPMKAAA